MLPPLWKQRAQKHCSANTSALSRNIPPPRWFPILCYFCTVQFKAGLQGSSLPNQRKAVPKIYNSLAAQGSLLHVPWAGWKCKCQGKQSSTAREAAPVQGTPSRLGLCALWVQEFDSTELGEWAEKPGSACRAPRVHIAPTTCLNFSSAPSPSQQ